ncbi:transporter substrate-binding domain-containing protein [Oscillatoria amoena NRMC-F 0135]|nr:transporter substrate-binding domain-containing protein [Oscillatoria laete-virens]MDL5048378.1 transporter substrate-binding domain-containing protein [Oscillatoria amoena NRMC-F 0135]
MPKSIPLLLVATLCVGLFLSACSPKESPSQKTIDSQMLMKIKTRGVLKVGVALFTPWAFEKQGGGYQGFEIELAEKLAADIGVKPQFVVSDFDQIIPKLNTGDIDIIISGMSITPERAMKVNFTIPYNESGVYIVGNRTSLKRLKNVEDLNNPKFVIGVVAGTVSEPIARKRFPKAELKLFGTDDECFQSLNLMQLDAVIASSPRPELEVIENPENFGLVSNQSLSNTGEAMAIAKGDADFLNFLNSWIFHYTANQWLSEKRNYWFRSLQWKTAEQPATPAAE